MSDEELIAERDSKKIYLKDNKIVKEFDLTYTKSDILNEALNQARVVDGGVGVPKIFDIMLEGKKRQIIMEYIKGDTLEKLIEKNPKKTKEYLSFMVDIEIDMHSRKIDGLKKLKDKLSERICISPYDATTRYELFSLLEKMHPHNKLCHGDFNPSNIIVKEDKSYAIIDWSHATLGNASADAANTYISLILQNNKKTADTYLDIFCKKSDTAIQYVKKWFPIVAAVMAIKATDSDKKILDDYVKAVFKENM